MTIGVCENNNKLCILKFSHDIVNIFDYLIDNMKKVITVSTQVLQLSINRLNAPSSYLKTRRVTNLLEYYACAVNLQMF